MIGSVAGTEFTDDHRREDASTMLKSKSKTRTQKMRDQAGEVMDRLAPHVETAREKAAPVIADAREKAGPMIAEAREKAAPYVTEAREKAAPVVEGAKTKFTTEVLPVITAAAAAAAEATEEVREEAKKRGAATAAAIKGEIEAPTKKSHKLRNILVILGLGGIAAFVAKRMSDREASTAWQSSYTPTPSSAGTSTTPSYSAPGVATGGAGGPAMEETPLGTAAAAAAAKARDEAGAGPDEAAADAAEQPHSATTPDNPVEEIVVDDEKK
jgi:vacuolar-type H+-ATPase subunit H